MQRSLEVLPASWTPANGVASEIAAALPGAIGELEALLAPAGVKTAVVLLREATREFQSRGDDALSALVEHAGTALAAYPLDLVEAACRRIVETHRYSTMPTTADFLAHVASELQERRNVLRRLRVAAMVAERQRPRRVFIPATDEEKAEVLAVVAATKRHVTTGANAPSTAETRDALALIVDALPDPDGAARWLVAMAAEDPTAPNHEAACKMMIEAAVKAGKTWAAPRERPA